MRTHVYPLSVLFALSACSPTGSGQLEKTLPDEGSGEGGAGDAGSDDAAEPEAEPAAPPPRPEPRFAHGNVVAYGAGALIIPMDTTYQDDGMLRAFGLVYALLTEGIPVQWIIEPDKAVGDADFNAQAQALVAGVPVGGSFFHDYRGGPFVVDESDAAAALPIVQNWQTTYPEVEVHEAVGLFSGFVSKELVAAPTIAMFADGNQKIARGYMQAAGIPDSVGDLGWPDGSPDMLTVAEVSGPSDVIHDDGALFDADGDPAYCQLMSMHWGVNDAEDDPEVVAEVREYLNNPVHFFAECQAVNAFENLVPHGFFLTPNGFEIGNEPDDVDFHNSDQPYAQMDGLFETRGGSEPSYTLPPGDSYLAGDIVMITEQGTPEGVQDIWMTGYLDGLCPPDAEECGGVGKISYLGAHSYQTDLPISTNPDSQGTRLFLNSLFEAPCASAVGVPFIEIQKSGPAVTAVPDVTYTITYSNDSQSTALNVTITDAIPPGSTYVGSCCGGVYNAGTGEVTWDLGNLGGGEGDGLTVDVTFDDFGDFDNTAHVDYYAGVTNFGVDSNVVSTTYAETCIDGLQNQDETGVDCGGVCPGCGAGGGCIVPADCVSEVCTGNTCQAPTCVDGVENQNETDVDCGGVCPGCDDGGACMLGADCVSGVCNGNVCQPGTCMDGVENQDETDIDCGGVCPACGDGNGCLGPADCESGACVGNVCQAPTCMDDVLNQDETDTDCGGVCPACDDGDGCGLGSDCLSGICNANVCQPGTCMDGVLNQDETDTDCGGVCPACDDGDGCVGPTDCLSGVCTGNVCQAPTCMDGVQNQDETATDCGGAACPPCGGGGACLAPADCDSGVCVGNVCQAPTCMDGALNQDETDIDCGGVCPACADGADCIADTDCDSGVCTGDVCQARTCMDGVQNQDETGLDCGGAVCPACDTGGGCVDGNDCVSGVCTDDECQDPTCDDRVQNQDETGLDCGGAECPACDDGRGCVDARDCISGVCTDDECQDPTCDDRVQNQDETDVDCGGSCRDCDGESTGGGSGGMTSGGGSDGESGADADGTAGGESDGASGGGQADDAGGSGGQADGTGGSPPAGSEGAGTGDGGLAFDDDSGGCGCRQGSGAPPSYLLWGLGLLGLRRRRRA